MRFMHQLQRVGENRLRQILVIDKTNNPDKIKGVIFSEIVSILTNYMDVNKNNVEFDIAVNDKGGFTLKLIADVKHLHLANHIL